MMFLGNIFATFFSYEFKTFGLDNNISDRVLSWAGSISALTQAITRLSTGALYDHSDFRTMFFVLFGVNLINSIVVQYTVNYVAVYFICI